VKASIVIGSSFGDEGKGYTVDTLCRNNPTSLVIRHNGGSQAGHTVETSDGRKHVFKSFGSGTFRGCPTLLSRFFIFNADVFYHELLELGSHKKLVMVDRDCKMTTPYDMILNWNIEDARDENRHGSCGYGINETEVRHEYERFRITVKDLSDLETYRTKLKLIEEEWVPMRLKQLGIDTKIVLSEKEIDSYLRRCKLSYRNISIVYSKRVIDEWEGPLVFEGAQGLLLDQNNTEFFPHVTRSNTGIKNACILLKEWGIKNAEVYYVTRSYLTRHGAGPMPFEDDTMFFMDKTNISNEYQGSLRFAPLNIDLLNNSINVDLQNSNGITINANIVVTCINQIEDELPYVYKDVVHKTVNFNLVWDLLDVKEIYLSNGKFAENCIKRSAK
jgi:adenylosuccinate synthase